jgi:hypothetical protein
VDLFRIRISFLLLYLYDAYLAAVSVHNLFSKMYLTANAIKVKVNNSIQFVCLIPCTLQCFALDRTTQYGKGILG